MSYLLKMMIEDRIKLRLGRAVDLEDASITSLEQLWYMAKDKENASDEQLTLALNAILEEIFGPV